MLFFVFHCSTLATNRISTPFESGTVVNRKDDNAMKDNDVVAIGELLVDFVQNGTSDNGSPLMEANCGGAPCNVLAMLTKLGRKTAFVGKVGNDYLGNFLRDSVASVGIDTSNLLLDNEHNTTLAFVSKLPNGDRDFAFYRNNTADVTLSRKDINPEIVGNAKILHFGTLSLTSETSKKATEYAVDIAKSSGALVSFDPNVRENLWHCKEDIIQAMEYGLSVCDVLKISDNEVEYLTGTTNYDTEIKSIQEKYNIPLVFLTLGKDGSRAYYQGNIATAEPLVQPTVVDATGAGDTFFGCALNGVLEHGLKSLDVPTLQSILRFANVGASLITQKRGALMSMPKKEQIQLIVNN
jgi:fructokinase